MSQEKVDRYKEQKANRKELIKKENRKKNLRKIAAAVLGAVCLGWVGYSVWGVTNRPDVNGTTVNLDAYTEYLSGLSAQK